MPNIFFTSDTHFHHRNVIDYNKRPFLSLEEHDEMLAQYWDERVGADDIVYHLGDFAFGGAAVWREARARLNGHIHLLLGNHDYRNFRNNYYDLFDSVMHMDVKQFDNVQAIMCHFPLLCFHGSDTRNVWNLYGHVHSGPKSDTDDMPRLKYTFRNQYDVGVDNNNYRPIEFTELRELMFKRFDNGQDTDFQG